jgi:hypothetical protein
MTRLAQAERQRQRILDALIDGPRTMVELRTMVVDLITDAEITNRRLAQYLLRMTNAREIKRARNGKRPDGKPCYVYRALVPLTVSSREIGARLAENVNGNGHKAYVRPAARNPVIRLFGGLYVPTGAQS